MCKRRKDKNKVDLIPANLGRPLTEKEIELIGPIAERVCYYQDHFREAVRIDLTDEVIKEVKQNLTSKQQHIFNLILLERQKFEEEYQKRCIHNLEQISDLKQKLSPYQQGVVDEILERSEEKDDGDPWWSYLNNVVQDIKKQLINPDHITSFNFILYRLHARETELIEWSKLLYWYFPDEAKYDPDFHAVLKALMKYKSLQQ